MTEGHLGEARIRLGGKAIGQKGRDRLVDAFEQALPDRDAPRAAMTDFDADLTLTGVSSGGPRQTRSNSLCPSRATIMACSLGRL